MPEGAPAADESKSTAEMKPATEKKDRSAFWFDLGKAAAMPLAALILGFVFNYSLSKSQARDSDMRLYTEMMGRREQADSDLRKDMFKAVLDKFMSSSETMQGTEKLDQQILELELLAYNFHESLDIGPLFKNLHRQILNHEAPESAGMRDRLEDLAQEVKAQQLSVLTGGERELPILTGKERLGMYNQASASLKADLKMDVQLPTIDNPQGNVMSGLLKDEPQNLDDRGHLFCLFLDSSDHQPRFRQFKLVFTRYSVLKREVEVWLRVSQPLSNDECKQEDFNPLKAEVDTRFWVGSFAFPMIDNTRLTDRERCAITLGEITDAVPLPVRLSYFPESRASLKDKPYYDEVMKQMAGKNKP
jgi:hypothetical protein